MSQKKKDRQGMDKCKIEAQSQNHYWSGKQICMKHFERVCVCSLRYRACNVHMPYCNSSLSSTTTFFCIISQAAQFFEKSYWTQNVCFYFLYNFCLKHVILRTIQWDITVHVYWSSCNVLVVLVRF
jgi:hypothetical protein